MGCQVVFIRVHNKMHFYRLIPTFSKEKEVCNLLCTRSKSAVGTTSFYKDGLQSIRNKPTPTQSPPLADDSYQILKNVSLVIRHFKLIQKLQILFSEWLRCQDLQGFKNLEGLRNPQSTQSINQDVYIRSYVRR